MITAERLLEKGQTLLSDAVRGGGGRFPWGWMIDTGFQGSPRVWRWKIPYLQSEKQPYSEAVKESETVPSFNSSSFRNIFKLEIIGHPDFPPIDH